MNGPSFMNVNEHLIQKTYPPATNNGSSRPKVFYVKGALNVFAKCKGVAVSFEADNVIKKGTATQMFFCKFSKLFKNTYFEEHVWVAAV